MLKNLLALFAAFFAMIGAAFAEVPTSVSTAISTTQADAVSVAGLMIGVTAALLVFKYIRRLMK